MNAYISFTPVLCRFSIETLFGWIFISFSLSLSLFLQACEDNPYFANCKLIVRAQYCTNKYYAKFCCRSCTIAGQLEPRG